MCYDRICLLLVAGKYNDKIQYVRTTPCTECPIGTTNDRTSADSKDECDSEWSRLIVWHTHTALLAEAADHTTVGCRRLGWHECGNGMSQAATTVA